MEQVKDVDGKKFEDFAIQFMKTYATYTQDERLDILMDYIPYIIQNFQDCSSEEEYRMLAKKSDNTLASIQISHKESGWLLYKPISLNAEEYKNFYYQTLVYALVQYVMFFQGVEFNILQNENIVGSFSISEQSLPHLLGLENKYVSNKDSQFMEKIIPGYNSLSVIEKILSLVENKEKIIQWEKQEGKDIFNYYKNMQKNKEFLLMGRFFSKDEEISEDCNKVFLLQTKDNQLSLYKKSNMNKSMNRNISKIIIQKGLDDVYFPRSLQAISEQILHTSEFCNLSCERPGIVVVDDIEAFVSSNGYTLDIKVPSRNLVLSKIYMANYCLKLIPSDDELFGKLTKVTLVRRLFEMANVSDDILEPYKDFYIPIYDEQGLKIVDADYLEESREDNLSGESYDPGEVQFLKELVTLSSKDYSDYSDIEILNELNNIRERLGLPLLESDENGVLKVSKDIQEVKEESNGISRKK